MRLFFGIAVEKDAEILISDIANKLQKEYEGKFTIPSNYHITLRYIGNVEEKVYDMLAEIGNSVFNECNGFRVVIKDVGNFKQGGITFLGIENNEYLNTLYMRLSEMLSSLGIVATEESGYVPHITLRRGKKSLISLTTRSIIMDVKRICLYESLREDGELIYRPLITWYTKE